jgi:hypothetical protein
MILPRGNAYTDLSTRVLALAEFFQHVITGSHGEGDNRHRCRLVGATWEDTRVADVQVGYIMSVAPKASNKVGLRVISLTNRVLGGAHVIARADWNAIGNHEINKFGNASLPGFRDVIVGMIISARCSTRRYC